MIQIRIIDITEDSVVDGPGLRTVVWCSGCKHHCKGCHNPETWSFNSGYLVDVEDVADKINKNKRVTFSGGDPMYQTENLDSLIGLLRDDIDIWIYTGFSLKDFISLFQSMDNLKERNFVVKCGTFEEDLKDPKCLYRGSSNQRIYQYYSKTEVFSDITELIDSEGNID